MSSYLELQDAIWSWAQENVPPQCTVIWDKPNVPRPCEPYVTLNLTTVSVKTGHDSWQYISGDDFRIGGQRTLTLSVIAYGPNLEEQMNQEIKSAQQICTDLRDSLENPLVLEKLRKNGLAVHNEPTVQDISALLESGFQDRANVDITFGYAHNQRVPVGIIEKVEGEAHVEGAKIHSIEIDIS